MRRPDLFPALVALAALALATPAAADRLMLDPENALTHEVRALHDDISLANLINGLGLTRVQLDELARLAAEADGVRERYQREAQPVLAEMDRSFGDLRDQVTAVGEPTPEVRHAAAGAEESFKELRLAFQHEMAALEGGLRAVLDDGQVQITEEFQPCLFPPEDLSSPLRVGQSGASTHVMQMLDEVRTLPPNTYARRLPRLLDGAIERKEQHEGPLKPEAEATARAEIQALVEELRGLDDLTWELEGPEIAVRFKDVVVGPEPPPPPHRRGPDPERVELTRVGQLLLAPGASHVLATIARSE